MKRIARSEDPLAEMQESLFGVYILKTELSAADARIIELRTLESLGKSPLHLSPN